MSTSIAYTTTEGEEIRKLLGNNQELIHLLPEVQFIGIKVNDIEALKFLKERIEFHNNYS